MADQHMAIFDMKYGKKKKNLWHKCSVWDGGIHVMSQELIIIIPLFVLPVFFPFLFAF